jgi:hypothetical protein
MRGTDTLIPQAVPPGTTEGSYPALEHEMNGLASRDYFLKTLDRPHYAGEDAHGMPPWLQKKKPAPEAPKQQVRKEGPQVAAEKP